MSRVVRRRVDLLARALRLGRRRTTSATSPESCSSRRRGSAGNATRRPTPGEVRAVLGARDAAREFIDWCADRVVEAQPRIVGFTSVFQQHLASLALAKRVKARLPDTFIVMGGANCEATMGVETVRQFAFVDAVVSGEADQVFAELASACLRQRTAERHSRRDHAGNRSPDRQAWDRRRPRRPSPNWTRFPIPDFSDFFDQFERSRFGKDMAAERVRRDVARLLVGRADALHVLRPQRRDDGVSQQVGAARARRADAPGDDTTRAATSRSSTTSST